MLTFIDIFNLLIFAFFTNYFYFITGSIFVFKFNVLNNNNTKNINDFIKIILGLIIISLIAVFLNFFFSLDKNLNTAIFVITYILGIFLIPKKIINLKTIKFISLISLFSSSILLFSNFYRPDASLYHLPYISILNHHEIIAGLNNIHFRYGLISILQYLSAFNFNFFFEKNGILIPSASAASIIIFYFFCEVKNCYYKKEYSLENLFSLSILIYISYKVNRYSEYGNDAVPALFYFFLISFILKENYEKIFNYKFIILISVFIFLNKASMIFVFFIPLLIYFFNYKNFRLSDYFKIIFSLPSFLLFIWFIKNIIISGCAIYPLKYSCIDTNWTDKQETQKISIASEAWSKGWPQNQDKNLDSKKFIKDFNWINAWSKKHFGYILKIIIPFVIVILILYFYLLKKSCFNKIKNKRIFKILLFSSLIGTVLFFLKFPLYRYGYGYLISSLSLLFAYFTYKKLDLEKIRSVLLIIFTICFLGFFGKQFVRIVNNLSSDKAFPLIERKDFHSKINKQIIHKFENLVVYKSEYDCYYSEILCTQYNVKKINTKKKFGFVIIEIK